MNFVDKYNSIIDFIEKNLHMKTDEIAQTMADRLQINKRVLGESFQFVTGLSLNEYVRNRRVVNCMRYKLQLKCSLDIAAEEFGFPDQPTLSRACKEAIGTTPSQVTEDVLNARPPLLLRELLGEREKNQMLPIRKSAQMNVFGTTKAQFSEIKLFLEENTFFDFNDDYLELVYQLKKEYDLGIEEAFEFTEDILLTHGEKIDDLVVRWSWEYALLRLKYNVEERKAKRIIEHMHAEGEKDITKVDQDYLVVYLSEYVQKHRISWDTTKSILILMKYRNIPVEAFGDIIDKAVFLFRGDVLAAVTCPASYDECMEHIRLNENLPDSILQVMHAGYVIEELREMREERIVELWTKLFPEKTK